MIKYWQSIQAVETQTTRKRARRTQHLQIKAAANQNYFLLIGGYYAEPLK